MESSNWKKISTVTRTTIHSSYNMLGLGSKDIHCGAVGEEKSWDIFTIPNLFRTEN
jgi:hypothetical protein